MPTSRRNGAEVRGQVNGQRVAETFGFSHVVDLRAVRCAGRSHCPFQQWLASKGLTRLQDTLRRRENGGLAAFGQRRVYFLPPVPNGDHGIVPAAQGAEGLNRAPLHLIQGKCSVFPQQPCRSAEDLEGHVASSTATRRDAAAAANEWA